MNYFKKSTMIAGWLAFAISLLVYILTLEPTASLWDCGEFIATSYKLEVGHPPGAPLFMMLNRFFSMFATDTSSVAYMVNVTSAVASALTIAFLFWSIALLASSLLGKKSTTISKGETWAAIGAGLVGALGYAFTDTFWFSAVEAEVYAQSSLFTAIVFWAILRWESCAEEPLSNKWLVLIAYLLGLSIGVHLLNLLAIPAIVFVYYYKFHHVRSKIGWLKALGVSAVLVAAVLYIIIPKSVEIGGLVDVFFVNSLGLPVNSGLATAYLLMLAAIGYGVWATYKKGKVLLNTILLCVGVLLVGYGSYASVVIRAQANPPMNSNNPDNPSSLLSFLNREQYGDTPLIYGNSYSSPIVDIKMKKVNKYNPDKKRYFKVEAVDKYVYADGTTMLFPRMHSSGHTSEYINWANIKGKKVKVGEEMVTIPTMAENLRYFFNYQVNFMYWRYFLWNFVGRQNDIQSQGDILYGNWLSGIKFIDEMYLGPQDGLPDSLANNAGRNTYFFLPFILGLIGIFYQMKRDRNNFTVVFWLFFMTGVAIILYLNQPPMQPRERDYAFAGSFYAFSIWMGLGVLWFFEKIKEKSKLSRRTSAIIATAICSVVPIILIAQNWDDHDRSGRYFTRDLGRSYLEGALPNSIILPLGDNDTFPLWYNQEVEGVRPDVRIMNLSYLGGIWYIEQMRDKSYDSEPVEFSLSKDFYRDNSYFVTADLLGQPLTIGQTLGYLGSDSKLKQMVKDATGRDVYIPTTQINIPVNKENAIKAGIIRAEEAHMALDTITLNLAEGTDLSMADIALIDAIGTADWSRAFSFTQPSSVSKLGLDRYLQLDGLAYRLVPFETPGSHLTRGRIDSEYLYDMVMNKLEFGDIKNPDVYIDYFVDYNVSATTIQNTVGRLAQQLMMEGDTIRAVKALDRIMEELPYSKMDYDYNSISIIKAYYEAGEIETADSMLIGFKEQVLQHMNYYTTFDDDMINALSYNIERALYNIQNIYVTADRYNRHEIVTELVPYLELLRAE